MFVTNICKYEYKYVCMNVMYLYHSRDMFYENIYICQNVYVKNKNNKKIKTRKQSV